GTEPATQERCQPGGDPAFVPPYDTSLLLDVDFQSKRPLVPPAPPSRERGWRASPIWQSGQQNGLAVKIVEEPQRHVALGFGLGGDAPPAAIAGASRAILAQEIRSARSGHYTFTVQASGGGSPAESFEKEFLAHFTCRLVLFRFADVAKDPRRVQELASATFRPEFGSGDEPKKFTLKRFLGSTLPNVNFPIGNGLGVAVVIEKKDDVKVPESAFVRIHSVSLDFGPRPRDESVVD
ncbi:MAG TPA: DUF1501 domain-containing protein, partial [Gemmataceae bacterium]|nr:DUF1501 domain-containing protein [Gemmataceae bacterium]